MNTLNIFLFGFIDNISIIFLIIIFLAIMRIKKLWIH